MSYFVIKGPCGAGQYLCVSPEYECPQWWHKRAEAQRFPDELSAWRFLSIVQSKYRDSGAYAGRVVRVNTLADWRAERMRLLAEIDRLRGLTFAGRAALATADAEKGER